MGKMFNETEFASIHHPVILVFDLRSIVRGADSLACYCQLFLTTLTVADQG